jgi:hypothetical protein
MARALFGEVSVEMRFNRGPVLLYMIAPLAFGMSVHFGRGELDMEPMGRSATRHITE